MKILVYQKRNWLGIFDSIFRIKKRNIMFITLFTNHRQSIRLFFQYLDILLEILFVYS